MSRWREGDCRERGRFDRVRDWHSGVYAALRLRADFLLNSLIWASIRSDVARGEPNASLRSEGDGTEFVEVMVPMGFRMGILRRYIAGAGQKLIRIVACCLVFSWCRLALPLTHGSARFAGLMLVQVLPWKK